MVGRGKGVEELGCVDNRCRSCRAPKRDIKVGNHSPETAREVEKERDAQREREKRYIRLLGRVQYHDHDEL